mmetsp:Transcript_46277/g.75747  ORF Transcript_46277/g.75747 Transcript_46277/m.75747 type:complete len:212 (+) Transcript_46277:1326-1961(+)
MTLHEILDSNCCASSQAYKNGPKETYGKKTAKRNYIEDKPTDFQRLVTTPNQRTTGGVAWTHQFPVVSREQPTVPTCDKREGLGRPRNVLHSSIPSPSPSSLSSFSSFLLFSFFLSFSFLFFSALLVCLAASYFLTRALLRFLRPASSVFNSTQICGLRIILSSLSGFNVSTSLAFLMPCFINSLAHGAYFGPNSFNHVAIPGVFPTCALT